MAVKKSGLGKGLDVLIPAGTRKPASRKQEKPSETTGAEGTSKKTTAAAGKTAGPAETKTVENKSTETLKLSEIEPNRDQPRKNFDEDALLELADSIRQFGLIQPLVVQKKGRHYEIIAGERRWRAAKLAGLKKVPVIIREYTDQEAMEISLIENIQRENLNPIEEATAFRQLLEEYHLKQDELAERVSKSRTAVTNSLRLLKLDKRVQQMMVDEKISAGHARTLLALEDPEQQFTLATRIFDEKLSVRETEKLIKALQKPPKKKEPPAEEHEEIYRNIEEKIKAILGTKVTVDHKGNQRGKILIEYYSNEELERILALLESIR